MTWRFLLIVFRVHVCLSFSFSLRGVLLTQERDVSAKARAAALKEKEISKKSLEISQKQQENSRKAREISQKEGDVSRREVEVSELERRVFQRETGVSEEERRLSSMLKELEGRKEEVDEREARQGPSTECLDRHNIGSSMPSWP